jgi:hypothetical protein
MTGKGQGKRMQADSRRLKCTECQEEDNSTDLVGRLATSRVEAGGNTPSVVVIDDTVDGISGALGGHPQKARSGGNPEL